MPTTTLPTPAGYLTVEVISNRSGSVIQSIGGNNSLTLEAIRLLLGQLVGPGLIESTDSFPPIASRPNPVFNSQGPGIANSIRLISLGYVGQADTVPSTQESPTDTELFSTTHLTLPLTEIRFGNGYVRFILEYPVTSSEIGNKFFEAGLFTLGENTVDQSGDVELPITSAGSIMFSRKVHSTVTGIENTTLRYTWTISMSDPE